MNNVVYNCDCMEFMKDIPDKYYELSICDPPYGININKDDMSNRRLKENKNKQWDICIPDKKYFKELIRISKNQIIWGGNYFLDVLGKTNNPIIWDKINPMFGKRNDFEFAWTNIKGTSKIFRYAWIGYARIWEEKDEPIHPTQKPIALYKWLLTNYAKPNEKIFDSHVGSGSIRIACHELGFDFTGCELDNDYWKAQEKRYQEWLKQYNNEFYIGDQDNTLFKDL